MLCTFSSACHFQLCGGPASCLDSLSVGLLLAAASCDQAEKAMQAFPDEHKVVASPTFLRDPP